MRHTARGWVVDARQGDEPIRSCVQQAAASDRVVLIADSDGERRAELLGLRTSLVFSPAALRRTVLMPRSSATRSLRRLLLSFEELVFSGQDLMNTISRVCAGKRSLPPRRVAEATNEAIGLPRTTRTEVRAALAADRENATETLIGLACDPDDSVNACDFVRVCQKLSMVGRRVTAVVPRRARAISRAKDIVRSTGIELRLVTAEVPLWCLLPGLDAAVLDVAESALEPEPSERARRWMARCCAELGIPAAIARTLADENTRERLALAESRLPVHVARALDAALRGVTPVEPRRAPAEPETVTA
jgi:hypothetical protein